MKHINKFSVLSNLFYIVPIYFSIVFGMSLSARLFIVLFISSTLYHIYKNKIWSVADSLVSYLVIIQVLILLNASTLALVHSIELVVIIIFALIIRYREEDKTRDDFWHGLWHIVVATVLTMAVIFHGML